MRKSLRACLKIGVYRIEVGTPLGRVRLAGETAAREGLDLAPRQGAFPAQRRSLGALKIALYAPASRTPSGPSSRPGFPSPASVAARPRTAAASGRRSATGLKAAANGACCPAPARPGRPAATAFAKGTMDYPWEALNARLRAHVRAPHGKRRRPTAGSWATLPPNTARAASATGSAPPWDWCWASRSRPPARRNALGPRPCGTGGGLLYLAAPALGRRRGAWPGVRAVGQTHPPQADGGGGQAFG